MTAHPGIHNYLWSDAEFPATAGGADSIYPVAIYKPIGSSFPCFYGLFKGAPRLIQYRSNDGTRVDFREDNNSMRNVAT